MEQINRLQELYDEYNNTAIAVRRSAKPFDGIFGLGNDPRKDPCHDAFYNNVQKWAEDFAASAPTPEQARAAALCMLETPVRYKDQEGYWYMYACIRFIEALIPFLARGDSAGLAVKMKGLYPRRDLMPVQKRVLKLLTEAGK